jgi:hypothetical protein
MNVLVIHDDQYILSWLVGEPKDSAEKHIKNGYPELWGQYQQGLIKATVIKTSEENAFKSNLYKVIDGKVKKCNGGT